MFIPSIALHRSISRPALVILLALMLGILSYVNLWFTRSKTGSIASPAAIGLVAPTVDEFRPLDVGKGQVEVKMSPPQNFGASALSLQALTSISGCVQNTSHSGILNVTIRISDPVGTTRTNTDGAFVFPDSSGSSLTPPVSLPETSSLVFEVDGSTAGATPPYGKDWRKMSVAANQNNQYPIIELRQLSRWIHIAQAGPARDLGLDLLRPHGPWLTGAGLTRDLSGSLGSEIAGGDTVSQVGGVKLVIPKGAKVSFPKGSAINRLNLAVFEPGHTPAPLPTGQFSSAIAQIMPFGATIAPGAQFIFPNPDGLPANQQVQLYRFDQTLDSKTLGEFVSAGVAIVSPDGKWVETAPTAIRETSYYFVSVKRPTAEIRGRVLENDGKQPVPRAIAITRGQFAFTDTNGNFVLRAVPVLKDNDQVTVEVSVLRPDKRVDRAEARTGVSVKAGGVTPIADIVMPQRQGNPLLKSQRRPI